MRLSILVVSCDWKLLNSLLGSLAEATKLSSNDLEILCSWNGSPAEEQKIINNSPYEFLIAQRLPYHFSSNMNQLAGLAAGELLMLVNDDIVLDPASIDAGIDCLTQEIKAGVVGGRLRNESGQLVHAGMLFDTKSSPYHQLENIVSAKDQSIINKNIAMPAITGALMFIRRVHFLQLKFNEKYIRCGEDVELCLDIREKLKLKAYYSAKASAIHEYSSTRQKKNLAGNNSEDLVRMRNRRRKFLEQISIEELKDEMNASQKESEALLSTIRGNSKLDKDLKYWKNQTHPLQLHRIKQDQEITRLKERINLQREEQ